MKVLIYVQPQDVDKLNKWLAGNSDMPFWWNEPLKPVTKRQSLVQVSISSDDYQKLLDAAHHEIKNSESPQSKQLKLL